jgi:hypothetical protein
MVSNIRFLQRGLTQQISPPSKPYCEAVPASYCQGLRGQITRTKRGSAERPSSPGSRMRRVLAYVIIDVTYWTTVMSVVWRFLRDKRNQQVLGWLGGGLVVAATGLWAVFVYFFPAGKSPEAKSPEPTPPSVQANCGGIAIGRDVTGSTITAGSTTNSDCAPKTK